MYHFRNFFFRVQLQVKMCELSSAGSCLAAGECMQIHSYVNILGCNKKFFPAVAFLPEGRDSLSLSLPCCIVS